jgi:formiminoglutamase
MSLWRPTDPQLFFSNGNPDDPRLGDLVRPFSESALNDRSFVIAGYPDDEGIRLNGGRVGAALAPAAIRKPLYKMTPALQETRDFSLLDHGDLETSSPLAQRHEAGAAACASVLAGGGRWIAFGGGHDYGFAEGSGFLKAVGSEQRPLVINFDAHFDVRPDSKGLSSGTPFFRLLSSGHPVDFVELGIQAQCNSRVHMKWLEDRGGRILTMEDVEASGESFETCAVRVLGDWILRPRPCFISVDIDAFSSAVAPGCSQSWATGFMPQDFFPLFDLLIRRLDVRVLGIYETSPPLDQDDRTSKLAALIAHRFISRAGAGAGTGAVT